MSPIAFHETFGDDRVLTFQLVMSAGMPMTARIVNRFNEMLTTFITI
jgi:hypothetical protein